MRNELSGVIRLGQLKRIQAVLYKNWKVENRFVNRNWNKEIEFIKKGRGGLIPVSIYVDLLNQDCTFQTTKDNVLKTKRIIENLLKFNLLTHNYKFLKPK